MNVMPSLGFRIRRLTGKRSPLVFHVFANKANAGDWLSASAIQNLLAPRAIMELYCDRRYVKQTRAMLRLATADDLIVIGGGGLIKGSFAPFWRMLARLRPRAPVVLWGIGACLNTQDGKPHPSADITRVAKQARRVALRDAVSGQYLVGVPDVSILPCPAMVEMATHVRPAKEPVCANAPPVARDGVLHVIHDGLVPPAVIERMRRDTRAWAERCGLTYREITHRIPPGDPDELNAVLDAYANAARVVSSRLHGCILGVGAGCKVVAVSNDRKIEAFMQQAGLGDWVVDAACPESIAERLERIDAQPDCRAFVEQAIRTNRAFALQVRGLAPALFPQPSEPDGRSGQNDCPTPR